jgi:protein YIPF1/2
VVSVQEVLKRMLGAIFFRRDLFTEVESKPDLYGPFWISTTCVFLMAMISNALDYIAHRGSGGGGSAWQGDLEKIVYGAAIMYGYVFGAGLVLWVWLKVISLAAISLSALWCIYGTSQGSCHRQFCLLQHPIAVILLGLWHLPSFCAVDINGSV